MTNPEIRHDNDGGVYLWKGHFTKAEATIILSEEEYTDSNEEVESVIHHVAASGMLPRDLREDEDEKQWGWWILDKEDLKKYKRPIKLTEVVFKKAEVL